MDLKEQLWHLFDCRLVATCETKPLIYIFVTIYTTIALNYSLSLR